MDLALDADDATPLVAEGMKSISRGSLRDRSDALARVLKDASVGRVMVYSDSPVDIIRAIDACARSGIDLYIAHTTIPKQQIDEIVSTHRIGYLVSGTDQPLAGDPAKPGRNEPRIHMMTSGTTGAPKIATHTLGSLLSRALATADHPANRMSRWLLTYQPSGFAGVQVILTAVASKSMVVAPAERTLRGFYEAAKQWQVTQISGTPTFWRSFLMAGDMSALRLRQITMGGEASDQATLDRVRAALPGARITHTYASTEAGMVFAVHDGKEGFPAAYLGQKMHGVELRIRDGFLQIRSPNRMEGYASPNAQPVDEDGWLATADVCEIGGDRVHILGRADNTINVGGYKVYPLAIENLILSVDGVKEARVYSVPNPISGALVAAEIVLGPGESETDVRTAILAACRQKLASYQVPRVLKIVDAIAIRASGKKG